MGRLRKINLNLVKDESSNLTINVTVKDIAIDSNTTSWTVYTFYSDLHMFQLPQMKVLIKQLSSFLHRSEENIVITSISSLKH